MDVADLNAEIYDNLCLKLNAGLKIFAGKMGYTIKQANYFKGNDVPADALLTHWVRIDGNEVPKLITIFEEMGKDDIVKVLKNSIENYGLSASDN